MALGGTIVRAWYKLHRVASMASIAQVVLDTMDTLFRTMEQPSACNSHQAIVHVVEAGIQCSVLHVVQAYVPSKHTVVPWHGK